MLTIIFLSELGTLYCVFTYTNIIHVLLHVHVLYDLGNFICMCCWFGFWMNALKHVQFCMYSCTCVLYSTTCTSTALQYMMCNWFQFHCYYQAMPQLPVKVTCTRILSLTLLSLPLLSLTLLSLPFPHILPSSSPSSPFPLPLLFQSRMFSHMWWNY